MCKFHIVFFPFIDILHTSQAPRSPWARKGFSPHHFFAVIGLNLVIHSAHITLLQTAHIKNFSPPPHFSIASAGPASTHFPALAYQQNKQLIDNSVGLWEMPCSLTKTLSNSKNACLASQTKAIQLNCCIKFSPCTNL